MSEIPNRMADVSNDKSLLPSVLNTCPVEPSDAGRTILFKDTLPELLALISKVLLEAFVVVPPIYDAEPTTTTFFPLINFVNY